MDRGWVATPGEHRRSSPVVGRLLVLFVVGPIVVLAALYGVSLVVGTELGNVVLAATGLASVAWFLTTGSRRSTLGMAGTSRVGALFGGGEEYAEQMSRGALREYRDPAIVLVTVTAALLYGWLVLALHRVT